MNFANIHTGILLAFYIFCWPQMSYICPTYIPHQSFYYNPSLGSFSTPSRAGIVAHYDCSLAVSVQNGSSVQTTLREAAGHSTEGYLHEIHFAKVAMGTVISTRGTD